MCHDRAQFNSVMTDRRKGYRYQIRTCSDFSGMDGVLGWEQYGLSFGTFYGLLDLARGFGPVVVEIIKPPHSCPFVGFMCWSHKKFFRRYRSPGRC